MNEQCMNEQCMICLETTNTTIASLTTLVKSCECSYWIHERCINTWLIKEPVCPICNSVMFYVDTSNNVLIDTIDDTVDINYIIRERKLLLNALAVCITVLFIVIIIIFCV